MSEAVSYDEPMLIHSVYFWFKPDADAAVVAAFESGLRRLTSISEIEKAYFGRPEATPKRDVIDDTYAWALVEIFADLQAHEPTKNTQFIEISCVTSRLPGRWCVSTTCELELTYQR